VIAALINTPLEHLSSFLTWWAGELSALARFRSASPRAWQILFLRNNAGCEVFVRSRNGAIEQAGDPAMQARELVTRIEQRIGKRSVPATQVVLRLQPREVVQKQISVPAAAREVLEPVLRNQLERLAPWPASKALLAFEVVGSESESEMLDVRMTITGRAMVEGLVAELEALGYAPGVVDCGEDAEAEPRINLLPRRGVDERRARRQLLSFIGLICGAALMACAFGAYGYIQNARELARLESRLDELRVRGGPHNATERLAHRQRIEARLTSEKRGEPSIAIVLEALSRALPDNAWLDRLEVGQGVVTLAGTSTNAANLIARVEGSGHFAHAQFAAPTTRIDGGNNESFTVTAEIVLANELEP
jgi:general secretion pathway protein L